MGLDTFGKDYFGVGSREPVGPMPEVVGDSRNHSGKDVLYSCSGVQWHRNAQARCYVLECNEKSFSRSGKQTLTHCVTCNSVA